MLNNLILSMISTIWTPTVVMCFLPHTHTHIYLSLDYIYCINVVYIPTTSQNNNNNKKGYKITQQAITKQEQQQHQLGTC